MKMILPLVLSAILMVHLLGHSITFLVQLRAARVEMKQRIKAEKARNAVSFRFSTADYAMLQKFEDEKEFLWEGSMYDVVSKIVANDTIYISAYCDHRETGLMGDITRFVAKNFQVPATKCKVPSFVLSDYDAVHYSWISTQTIFCSAIPVYVSAICIVPNKVLFSPPDFPVG